MNLETKTCFQLSKLIKRGYTDGKTAAFIWAERIERGPVRSALPKRIQRKIGLLPPVK